MNVTTKVELSGPFFRADPKKTWRQNVRAMMRAIAEEGERSVRNAVTFERGPEPYHIADDITGRVESLGGKPWALNAVVSIPNARRGHVFSPYARKLDRRTKFFSRGVRAIRKQRREAMRLLEGLQ